MSDRSENINAAGSFLRAVQGRAGAQGADEAPRLPFAQLLAELLSASDGIRLEELAVILSLQRTVLLETLSGLRDLGLISIDRQGQAEIVSLTELGRSVARQPEHG
jgi:DNA-binding transcriptional ArsR family regulator